MASGVATSTNGLSQAEVAERVARGATNHYRAESSRSAWTIVRANVFTLFNGIVFACFFVLFLVGRWQDALFGIAAFTNAVIGCIQEFRAKSALDRLALLNAPHARVRRAGDETEIPAGEVVLDDLLVIRAGDQVTADAVVVAARGLQIDESMLTGESDAVDKVPGDDALSGSIIVAGEGIARVERVGADSYANRFAGEAKRFSLVTSELRTSVNRVLKWVGWGIGPIGLLVFNSQVLVAGGYRVAFTTGTWVDAVVNTIAALTAMIPLGLVLMTSIAFAVGAAKLAARKVLVNELPAVEGLARVDVICLDKTGTLTVGEIGFDAAHPLTEVDGWRTALGWYAASPDANATARAMTDAFPDVAAPQAGAYIPFSSARKWSAVSFEDRAGTWVLGAPEMLFGDDASSPHTDLGRTVARLAASGRRTLVLAHSPVSTSPEEAEAERLVDGLSPAVVLTFREQVRPDAAQTLEYFRQQGVGVRIISGDNPRTVAAIAREVGLDAGEGVDARTLPDDPEALAELLEANLVFGRVTPEQKKSMVTALQSRGHTVAMTGDGVNDALAIKTADIGIAMNSGSAATKAVARLVLLDGRFSHLPSVVAEGRQVIANIERVSMLFLTKTSWATLLAVIFGLLVVEFPFLPRQLSVTDGLTIGIPAFFLALMPNAQRYVPGFLRRSLTFAIPAGVVMALGITWYTLLAEQTAASQDQLRTGTTIILAVVGIWILAVLSRPLNRYKVLVIGSMFIGLVLVFSIPFAKEFFVLVDPGQDLAVILAGIIIVMIVAIEVVRFVHHRVVLAGADAARHGHHGRERRHSRATLTIRTIIATLTYAAGIVAAGFGVLVLLSRYQEQDPRSAVIVSLAGAGIALIGLLVLAIAGGVSRGSGLSRLLLTVFLALVAVLSMLVIATGMEWDLASSVVSALSIIVIVLLWVPPGSRGFGRVRDSSMLAAPRSRVAPRQEGED